MPINNVKIKDNRCFTEEWCGFDEIKPINIIIGRNNTGKSLLLDLIKAQCEGTKSEWTKNLEFRCRGTLSNTRLRSAFPENVNGGILSGNHWHNHGKQFIGKNLEWISSGGRRSAITIIDHDGESIPHEFEDNEGDILLSLVGEMKFPLQGKIFKHLLADRDIKREVPSKAPILRSDGSGATDIIRKYITSAQDVRMRLKIQNELLLALNDIFGLDGTFTEIQVQHHDYGGEHDGTWEIFLGEEKKGLVSLSNSGSGLKTVILVLLNLLIVPDTETTATEDYIYAFEELENNLHPAMLRRLLRYISEFTKKNECTIFLTTHSSAALDLFSRDNNAQFVRISHNGSYATTQTISNYFEKTGVINELGTKASDILQANGIIWVEGPSDAIYINRWIDLFSNGNLIEGRDYACAFYGGSLLARAGFTSPDEKDHELVNLIPLNRNVALVCDSDKKSKNALLKPRVIKARDALTNISDSSIWVTAGREIETYLPGEALNFAFNKTNLRPPEQYERIFPSSAKSRKDESYVEQVLGLANIDKIELALKCIKHITIDNMANCFDWKERMKDLTQTIYRWNQ